MKQIKPYRVADPLFWGGCGGTIAGIIGILAVASGAVPEGQSVMGYMAGGFFWCWATANFRNWLAKR